MRGSKAELEEMGEETDGLATSTSKLRSEILALSGVDIMTNDNTYKSTAQIIQELGEVYDEMSDVSQANITACMYRNMHKITHLKPVKPKALSLQYG